MRMIDEIRDNSQVQITENVKTTTGDAIGMMGYINLRGYKHTMAFMATVENHGDENWEHVSVSYYNENKKTPSWGEMCAVKDIFWQEEEEAHQIHPKHSEYVHGVGNMENVLHLWRPAQGWKE